MRGVQVEEVFTIGKEPLLSEWKIGRLCQDYCSHSISMQNIERAYTKPSLPKLALAML